MLVCDCPFRAHHVGLVEDGDCLWARHAELLMCDDAFRATSTTVMIYFELHETACFDSVYEG